MFCGRKAMMERYYYRVDVPTFEYDFDEVHHTDCDGGILVVPVYCIFDRKDSSAKEIATANDVNIAEKIVKGLNNVANS